MINYGKKLKSLRKQVGLSANALARQVNLDPTTIYKIESNTSKPSLDALEKICLILGISMRDFFSNDDIDVSTHQSSKSQREISMEDLAFLRSFKKLPPKKRKAIEILVIDDDDSSDEWL